MKVSLMCKWRNLDSKLRVTIIAVALTLVLAVFAITRPTYVSLFSESLSSDQAIQYSKVLEEAGISSKTSNDETVLKVKTQDYDNARLAISMSTLASSGFTFSEAMDLTDLETKSEKK